MEMTQHFESLYPKNVSSQQYNKVALVI